MANTYNHCGRKRWPMVTLYSKHKNNPSKGQTGRGQHPKRRKTSMHGTNSGILLALFCVPGAGCGGWYLRQRVSVITKQLRQSRARGDPWSGLSKYPHIERRATLLSIVRLNGVILRILFRFIMMTPIKRIRGRREPVELS